MARFLRQEHSATFDQGWVGASALRELKISSIPAWFVLDTELRVIACVRGYQGYDDSRIASILDEHLDP
jgi:hypothetical protein